MSYETQTNTVPNHNLPQTLGGLSMASMLPARPELYIETSVESLFQSGRLLVRGIEPPKLGWSPQSRSYDTIDYGVVDREVADLLGTGEQEALIDASTTLLLPDKAVPTYKSSGFIFDGSSAEIRHISDTDSASNGQGEDFWAIGQGLASLDELKETIDHTPGKPTMNEVVGTFHSSDLKGLFAVDAPLPKIEAYFMQKRIADTRGIDVPLYVYDPGKGALSRWEPTLHDMQVMVAGYRGATSQAFQAELQAIEN